MTRYLTEKMTPDIAIAWLARPWERQRRLSPQTIRKYARAMADGRWFEPSLDPIAFTSDGRLINGQHRLSAVVESGWSGEVLVAYDVPPEVFKVIDTGRPRVASQFVRSPSATAVTAVSRMALWYDERWPSSPRGLALAFDNDRLIAYIDEHEADLTEAVRDCERASRRIGASRKSLSSAVYIARTIEHADADRLEAFIDGLGTGVGLGLDDPRLALRNRWVNAPPALRRESAFMWQVTVRALNAWLQGRTMNKVMYDPGDEPPRIDPRLRYLGGDRRGRMTRIRPPVNGSSYIAPS